MPENQNSDSDSESSTPRKVRLTLSEYIAKYTDNIEEVRGTYNDKIMIKNSINNFVISKNELNYSQHLDSFFVNDVDQKIKETLEDKVFLTEVVINALNSDNLEFIVKIIPFIDNKKNLEKLNQLLTDNGNSNSQIPSTEIQKVKNNVNRIIENFPSCNIS